MKKLLLVALASTMLAGCGMSASEIMMKGEDGPNTFTYQCRSIPLVVTVDQKLAVARVLIDGQVRVLPQIMSASGAKYGDDTYTFWSKGNDAGVYRGETVILDECKLQD